MGKPVLTVIQTGLTGIMTLQVSFALVHAFCTSMSIWTSGSTHAAGKVAAAAVLTPPMMLRVRQRMLRPNANPITEASMTVAS